MYRYAKTKQANIVKRSKCKHYLFDVYYLLIKMNEFCLLANNNPAIKPIVNQNKFNNSKIPPPSIPSNYSKNLNMSISGTSVLRNWENETIKQQNCTKNIQNYL